MHACMSHATYWTYLHARPRMFSLIGTCTVTIIKMIRRPACLHVDLHIPTCTYIHTYSCDNLAWCLCTPKQTPPRWHTHLAYMHTNTRSSTHTCACTHTHAHTDKCMYTHPHSHWCTHTCSPALTHICTPPRSHTGMQTCNYRLTLMLTCSHAHALTFTDIRRHAHPYSNSHTPCSHALTLTLAHTCTHLHSHLLAILLISLINSLDQTEQH